MALPNEIISDEIFARLPAKSALGCRLLSSAWAATLSSDDFADCYNALHAGRPKIFRLQHDSHGDVDQQAKSRAPPPIPIAVTGECFPRYVTVHWDEPQTLEVRQPTPVTTHCRGLILVDLVPNGIHFVCNPSTGQKRALPEGRTTGCRIPGELMDKYASLGLGYNTRTRRHKVVRICYRGRDRKGRPASVGCEVYVVNDRDEDSSGTWRPVSSTSVGWVEPGEPSVFAQGHVYWFAHREHRRNGGHTCKGKTIVSFSISEETFGTVAPPPAVHVMEDKAVRTRCLTELGGRLCLFSGGSPPHDEHRYDVWLLDESSTTWDLYCQIDAGMASPEVSRALRGRNNWGVEFLPLAITDNGRRLLLARYRCPEDRYRQNLR